MALPLWPVTQTLALHNGWSRTRPITTSVIGLQYTGANPTPLITSAAPLPGVANFLQGTNQANWRTNVTTYAGITYQQIYPGIDLHFDGTDGQLKSTYSVAPTADPTQIRWHYRGNAKVRTHVTGNLLITIDPRLHDTQPVTITEATPTAWQTIDGKRVPVTVRYTVAADNSISFAVGGYDTRYELTIDPTLVYTKPFGGGGIDSGYDIAADSAGNAYVSGQTTSTNFPTTVGARQTVKAAGEDGFVTKLVWNGTTLSYGYSTFLGGNGNDQGTGIAVDGLGNAYVVGNTTSTVFPTANPLQSACGDTAPSCFDVFVAKLNTSGSTAIYSTYLGGSYYDFAWNIAVNGGGSAYVTGQTDSSNFPTTSGAFQTTNPAGTDAFVTKLVWNGTALSYGYSTYLGGSGTDDGDGIAVDSAGNAYITGATTSTDFPTRGPLQSANGGGTDAFVSWLSPTGARMMYGTYLGGSSFERGFDIASDAVGNVYLTGLTQSSNFPTAGPVQGSAGGGYDAFVSKLNLAQRVTQYTYDGLNRLLGANEIPGTAYTYAYDLVGNRTSMQVNGGTPTTTTYNAANQITSAGFTYDNAGNLFNDGTAAYTYDALNRMLTRGGTTYTSNGDGTLVSQATGGVTTRYTQDLASPLSQVLQTKVGAATATDYIYGLNRLASLNGTTKTWYAADALGSVRRTVADAGTPLGVVNYDPWGTVETGACRRSGLPARCRMFLAGW